MPRSPRPVADGLLYPALNRGNNRDAVFFTPADYLLFLKALAQTQRRYPFRLFGYCLMTNHFHLLLALVVLRYIEANPLRAGMVADLAGYPWSSYVAHGLGKADPLLRPLPA
jgi:putative transposase